MTTHCAACQGIGTTHAYDFRTEQSTSPPCEACGGSGERPVAAATGGVAAATSKRVFFATPAGELVAHRWGNGAVEVAVGGVKFMLCSESARELGEWLLLPHVTPSEVDVYHPHWDEVV